MEEFSVNACDVQVFFLEVSQKFLETEVRQSRSTTKNEHFYLLPGVSPAPCVIDFYEVKIAFDNHSLKFKIGENRIKNAFHRNAKNPG